MIGFDGWPVPPDPTPPADLSPALGWFCLAVAFLALLLVLFIEYSERFFRNEERTRDKLREDYRKRVEALHDALLEQLIDASPGGRKPWQERRK